MEIGASPTVWVSGGLKIFGALVDRSAAWVALRPGGALGVPAVARCGRHWIHALPSLTRAC
jgi:hypothetical protein